MSFTSRRLRNSKNPRLSDVSDLIVIADHLSESRELREHAVFQNQDQAMLDPGFPLTSRIALEII